MSFFTDLPQFVFLQNALWAGLLASLACGIVGTYVVTRRITYLAGGIAHSVLAGLGVARYLEVVHGVGSHPFLGALIAGLLAALIIGVVSLKAHQREDTVIGAIWAIGMAVGILFIARTPGYNQDLMSYLFGNILMVSGDDLRLLAGLDAAIVVVGLAFYNQFVTISFDAQFARLRGLNVGFYYLLLLCLTALTVVLLVSVVGIILVIALLTLPAAIAGNFAARLWQIMILAVVLSAGLTSGGLVASYALDLPTGATIIVLAGAAYLLTTGGVTLARRGRV
jgi:zinc transport system permease protein